MKPSNSIEAIRGGIEFFKSKSKRECEFVITRFREPLEWTKGLEHLCTVYNKGDMFELSGATIKDVPNNGVGLETILRHIIENYNTLASTTFFCQGTIADRQDQPLYPFRWYFEGADTDTIRANDIEAYDLGTSKFLQGGTYRRTLAEFRDQIVGIPYKNLVDRWVKGDWIAVGRNVIQKKPKAYYEYVYKECHFERGIFLEECYFLERSLYTMFTKPYKRDFERYFTPN
jgi:hypothetical protein